MGIFKQQLSELLSLPKEVILNLPQITIIGYQEINIENYKNIIELTSEKVRINTSSGILLVAGHDLLLKSLTSENLILSGNILKLEYLL